MSCEGIRERLHEAFDESPSGALPDEVEAHLATCAGCREWRVEIEALRASLRGLPPAPLPPQALDTVWARTVRAPRGRFGLPDSWRAAAAAVVVTALGATTLYFVSSPVPSGEPSRAELARAEAQAELVFGYTARALRATRNATARDVIADKISPAVRGDVAPRTPRRIR